MRGCKNSIVRRVALRWSVGQDTLDLGWAHERTNGKAPCIAPDDEARGPVGVATSVVQALDACHGVCDAMMNYK